MRRYKISCRFCLYFTTKDGYGWCSIFNRTTIPDNSCENDWSKKK